MMVVPLSWAELSIAADVGKMRRILALKAGRPHRPPGNPDASWTEDITGAIAELAVSKWVGSYWASALNIGMVDVAGAVQVRSKTQENHRLVIRRHDVAADVFVCVLVSPQHPHLPKLCGWLRAEEARCPQWLDHANDRWMVPDEHLHPMDELQATVGISA